mmetsp:Transcript_19995/g.29945  ORF Transcript_19995/g.29945 Transcript_19995/m.29945 type:complete len:277 (-) Transcript_19995:253-1083(-)|eukprot:CAMPEP_0167755330 /NCGR_PEP_ID=MMETSP0110_2-20121227/8761_1 /TAXON_ID=629695 /ORGANISM="Gymnochlora sp., Strain CCMP2014" /LENGTH=276 /DNA_ID=CAMNT_0007641299 /DNA_START=41 /DNA_END=871 /DNA_ORIENTATION=-
MHRRTVPLACIGAIFATSLLLIAVSFNRNAGTARGDLQLSMRATAPRMSVSRGLPQRMSPLPSFDQSFSRGLSVRADAPTTEVVSPVVEEDEDEKEAIAHLRHIRGSTHKYRRVIDTIRGRSYEEALAILQFMPYRACENVLKVVRSAAANAAHNYNMKKSKLYIDEIWADEGPTLKRFKFRSQGRVNKIRKPTSHLFVRVKEREPTEAGSKVFARRRKIKEVGPFWKGRYIEDPVEVTEAIDVVEEDVASDVADEPAVEAVEATESDAAAEPNEA